MKVCAILSVLFLGLISGAHGVAFNCSTMEPVEEGLHRALTTPPFGFTITPDTVQSRGTVTVKLYSTQPGLPFTSFMVAAHNMLQPMKPIGSWTVDVNDTLVRTAACQDGSAAVLEQASYDPKAQVTATWTAPNNLLSNVEFMATVSISNLTYWMEINSIEVRRVIPLDTQTPRPEVVLDEEENDPHSDLKESQQALAEQMKKQEMIDDEVRYSEGDWQRQEVEAELAHQQLMQWEMQQYEQQVQEEEQRRQESIRAEIMDQEEHAVEDAEEQKEEVEEKLEEEVEEVIGGEGDGILSDDNVIDLDHFLSGDSVGASSHLVASLVLILATAIMGAIL